MAENVVDDAEALSTSSDGDSTGNFVISLRTCYKHFSFHNECGMKKFFLLFIDLFALNHNPTGLFENFPGLGAESARAFCLLISQQLLALELSFKFA